MLLESNNGSGSAEKENLDGLALTACTPLQQRTIVQTQTPVALSSGLGLFKACSRRALDDLSPAPSLAKGATYDCSVVTHPVLDIDTALLGTGFPYLGPGSCPPRIEEQDAGSPAEEAPPVSPEVMESPVGELPVFAWNLGSGDSPGCTPMPRSYGSLRSNRPLTPRKLMTGSPSSPQPADAMTVLPGFQACTARSTGGIMGMRPAARVRVRRALNLHTAQRQRQRRLSVGGYATRSVEGLGSAAAPMLQGTPELAAHSNAPLSSTSFPTIRKRFESFDKSTPGSVEHPRKTLRVVEEAGGSSVTQRLARLQLQQP